MRKKSPNHTYCLVLEILDHSSYENKLWWKIERMVLGRPNLSVKCGVSRNHPHSISPFFSLVFDDVPLSMAP